MCDYSIVEGCIRQSTFNPIENSMKTTEITFEVPLEGGENYRRDQCAEHIAQLLDQSFGTAIEDLGNIHNLIAEEIVESNRRQERENLGDAVNGGSK